MIMRDPLVLRYEQDEKPQQIYSRFLTLQSPIREEVWKLGVRHDEKRLLILRMKLSLNGEQPDIIEKVMQLEDVLSTNAFDLSDHPKSPGGLFLTASRLNHSCVPNADYYYDDKSGCKSVFANRDIDAGEEITISYIDHLNMKVQRQLELRIWGFVCRCPACDVRHPGSGAHEQRLQSIHQAHQDSCIETSGRLKAKASRSRSLLDLAAKRAQRRIELLTEHHSLRKFSRQAYLGAFDIALAQYKLTKVTSKLADTIKLLDRVIELDLLYDGDNSAAAEEHRKLYLQLK